MVRLFGINSASSGNEAKQTAHKELAQTLLGQTGSDSRRLLPEVLRLFDDGRFDPLAVPTTIVPWDRADEAWLEPATKLVLERG